MIRPVFLLIFSMMLITNAAAQVNQTQDVNRIYVTAVAWSPDGTQLAAVGAYPEAITEQSSLSNDAHGYISVIDGLNGSTIFAAEPPSAFTSVAWSPDGERLVLGSFDGTVWIVDAATGERITNLFGHQSTVTDVDWNSDGTQIISSGNWDELVILWDATNYTVLSQWEINAHPNAVAFGVGDRTVAVGTEGGLYEFPLNIEPNSRVSTDYRIIREWILDFAYGRDGRYLATGTIAHVSSMGVRDNARITIYDLITQKITHQFESPLGSISGLSWSVDNRYLAVLNEDDVMTLWDVEAGAITATYSSFGSDRYNKGGIAYSLYGGRLAFNGGLNSNTSSLSEDVTVLGDAGIQIVVPDPSLERLQAIAEACNAPTAVEQSLTVSIEADRLPEFVAQVESLPADAIPPACRADLLAVAEALAAHP